MRLRGLWLGRGIPGKERSERDSKRVTFAWPHRAAAADDTLVGSAHLKALAEHRRTPALGAARVGGGGGGAVPKPVILDDAQDKIEIIATRARMDAMRR